MEGNMKSPGQVDNSVDSQKPDPLIFRNPEMTEDFIFRACLSITEKLSGFLTSEFCCMF